HFGYVYVDEIFVGDEADAPTHGSSFGYLALNPINDPASDGYEPCSLVQLPSDPSCAPALPVLNPTWPIQVCGIYEDPVSAQYPIGLDNVQLRVYHNGSLAATVLSTLPGLPAGQFCFEVNQADLGPGPHYGQYTFEAEIIYNVQCSGGVPISVMGQ